MRVPVVQALSLQQHHSSLNTARALETWGVKHGIHFTALKQANVDGLRGMVSTRQIEPSEPLVVLPANMMLSEDLTVNSAPPGQLSAALWSLLPWYVRFAVRLLIERAAGERSVWQAYVDFLPKAEEITTPLHWAAHTVDLLLYQHLARQVRAQRRLFRRYHSLLLQATACKPGCTLHAQLQDPANLSWALECVLSRAYQLPPAERAEHALAPNNQRVALLPVIDSINHHSSIPTHMYWQQVHAFHDLALYILFASAAVTTQNLTIFHRHALICVQDGALAVAVDVSYDTGDHVFVSFGAKSNDDLLQYYGFVERDNSADCYVLADLHSYMCEDAQLRAAAHAVSSVLHRTEQGRSIWKYIRTASVSSAAVHPATMQALRLVCCSCDAAAGSSEAAAAAWDGTERDLERFSRPVTLSSELKAWKLIEERCEAAAASLTAAAGSSDDDLQGLDAETKLMVGTFREEKVQLLANITARLKHLQSVSTLLGKPIALPSANSMSKPPMPRRPVL
jgi:hypothetical protein